MSNTTLTNEEINARRAWVRFSGFPGKWAICQVSEEGHAVSARRIDLGLDTLEDLHPMAGYRWFSIDEMVGR